MLSIGLFYGSTTCYTEIAAEKIQQQFTDHNNDQYTISLANIKDIPLSECLQYDVIIFGISTWDYGELQEDWENHWADIANLDLSEKIVALYGMGDQIGYTDWFQDALGMLHEQVINQGGYVIGYWPNQGYEFAASKALTDDNTHFVGLALDEDNQYDLSDERINQWCKQLINELDQLLNQD